MQKLLSVNEMTKYRQHLSVPPDDVNAVHEFLQIIWTENPGIPLRDQMSFETAIVELVANIISYSAATCGVTCAVEIETSEGQVDAIVSDNGELVILELDEHIMPDEFAESGRGIPLIKALVDEFTFDVSENRNIWRLSKKFKS